MRVGFASRLLSISFVCSLIVAVACHGDNADFVPDMNGDDMPANPAVDMAGVDGNLDAATDDVGTLEPDGGAAPGDAGSVGAIACGSMPCDVAGGTNVCCESIAMSMVVATCEPKASCTMGITRACDGTEDCPSGDVCCVGNLGATSCEAKCNLFQPEACHSKDECPAPAMGRTAACCPVSQTLRVCRTFGPTQQVPTTCD